jgi:hypothetical protein
LWNTAVHMQDTEADPAKRAFTITELQVLFDYADDQVTRSAARAARTGCRLFGTRHG